MSAPPRSVLGGTDSQASPARLAPSRRSVLAPLLVAWALALAPLAGWSWAQSAPRVGVSPITAAVGDTVIVEADRLTPSATYRLEARAPSGASEVTEATADPTGAVRFEPTLREPGTTELRLSGPGVDAALRVRASAPTPGARPEPLPPPTTAPHDPDPTPDPRPEPPPAEPAPPVPPEPPAITPPEPGLTLVLVDDGAELREADGSLRWRFTRPEGSGDTRAAELHLGRAWIAHGATVLELDLGSGRVEQRTLSSGPIIDLVPLGTGVRVVSEVPLDAVTTRVEQRVEGGRTIPLAAFHPSLPTLRWWQAEAAVADPSAALERDPTNPFLHLRVAELADDAAQRDAAQDAALEAALAANAPFFVTAQVARAMAAHGRYEAADAAMGAALLDFEARGYDPGLLTDADAHEAYGFALRPLRRALADGDREAAELWARWLPRTAGPGMPGAAETLREYASLLRDDGQEEAAAAVRASAGELAATSVREVLSNAAVNLGRGGWYAASALVTAAVMLHLTLLAKYWRVQSLLIRRARETGRRASGAWRLRVMRHYGTTEKLALVLLLAAAHAVAALAVWTQRGDAAAAAAAAGHVNAPFVAPLLTPDAPGDPGSQRLLEAYRLWHTGDREAAARRYEVAVLEDVPNAEASLEAIRAGERPLAPTPATLRAAAAGTWGAAVAAAYRDPLGYLAGAEAPAALPAWASVTLLVVFLVVALLHLAALLVPRPRLSRNAPRTLPYHVLALLVPGSGAADELWGVLLLVPWAVFGIDALVQLGWAVSPLDIPFLTGLWVLSGLYAINLVAWGIELGSYLRRMRDLRREQPDVAQEFGMKPLVARD